MRKYLPGRKLQVVNEDLGPVQDPSVYRHAQKSSRFLVLETLPTSTANSPYKKQFPEDQVQWEPEY